MLGIKIEIPKIEVHVHDHGNSDGHKLDRILKKLEDIMSAISDFATKMNEHNTKVDAAVDGLTADIKTLNDKITELQNSAGTISPEDQAILDELEARGAAVSAKLAALDALTPPAAPPIP